MSQKPLRFTQQLAVDRWITNCRICPKRYGRASGSTESKVDQWWAEHVKSRMHQRQLAVDGELSAEQRQLYDIFGGQPSEGGTKPSERSGQVIKRPRVGSNTRREDNPLGPR